MDDDLKRKLTRRYRNYNNKRVRHPDVPRRDAEWDHVHDLHRKKREQYKLIRRRPSTAREVKLGWEGLVAFMDFFGGDRKLAAESCNVSQATINRCIRLGYVTPYVAICAQDIESMPWGPAGLCRYMEYEYEWDLANNEFEKDGKVRRDLKDRALKEASWVKQKTHQ